jgi:hypothetical protein
MSVFEDNHGVIFQSFSLFLGSFPVEKTFDARIHFKFFKY